VDSVRTLSVRYDIAGGKSATVSLPHCKTADALKENEEGTRNVIESVMDYFAFAPLGISGGGVKVTTKETEVLF
jgi:hypothetical protein